ncbi:hypothetical protein ACLKA7_001699 [Drosophila subpalustris]
MDKNQNNQYPKQNKMESNSSENEDRLNLPENSSRRSGMRFSTNEDFLASLNTATTAVGALQGLQSISLERYQKCMQGLGSDDNSASHLKSSKKDDDRNDGDG